MLEPDQVVDLHLTASDLQIVLAGLGELLFRISAPVADKIRKQILEVDPTAFGPPASSNARDNVIPMGEAVD